MGLVPTPELVEFIESGVSIIACTRDDQRVPHVLRGCGARWSAERGRLLVYFSAAVAAPARADVAANGAMAVTFVRIYDYHAVQLKGRAGPAREARPEERPLIERHHTAFSEQLYFAGVPRALSGQVRTWPAVVFELEVAALYEQTPGPRAGVRLEAHEA